MPGTFPKLSYDALSVASGRRGITVNGRLVDPLGARPHWRKDGSILWTVNNSGQPDDGRVMLWDGSRATMFAERGYEGWSCHNGTFAAWRSTDRLKGITVSESGHVAGIEDLGGSGILKVDGIEIDRGLIYEARYTRDVLVWTKNVNGVMRTFGKLTPSSPNDPLSVLPDDEFWPVALVTHGHGVWVLNHGHKHCFVRPWGETQGYIVRVGVADRPDWGQRPDGVIRVVFSDGGALHDETLNLDAPREDVRLAATESVLDTTSTVDVVDYFPIGLNLDGSHLLAFRMTGQQPNVLSVAKHTDGGGEWWAWDDQWVYVHMDQGGSPIQDVASGIFTPRFAPNGDRIDAYYFTPDARTWPRRMKTGDAFTLNTRLYYLADGPNQSGIPWPIKQSFEVYSTWPTPYGPLPAIRQKSDPRTRRDPNGRLKGGYEYWTFARSQDKRVWYVTWEQWRTKDDNSGDEIMVNPNDGKPLFREFRGPVSANVTWRLSRRPANAPLLPVEDDMNKPGVTIDHYGSQLGPIGTWSVEFHDRNNPGVSGKVEIVNGSVHVTMTNPEGSDRSGNRRPVEIRS